jgi:hypothetical protein
MNVTVEIWQAATANFLAFEAQIMLDKRREREKKA